MRGGIFYHGMIAAVLLSVAACGGKDKEKKAADNAAANEATTEATPETAEDKAAKLAAKVKDFNDGNGGCEECQATEARVRAEVLVQAGLRTYTDNPSCMNEARETAQIRDVSDDAAGLKGGQFAGAVGDLLKNKDVQRVIGQQVGGDVGRILNGGDDRTAYCQAVCAVLPENSTVTGYKLPTPASIRKRSAGYSPTGRTRRRGWRASASISRRRTIGCRRTNKRRKALIFVNQFRSPAANRRAVNLVSAATLPLAS